MSSLNTPKAERDEVFYEDQFTSASNWGAGEFENFCEVVGFVEPDTEDFFGNRASRVWGAMTEQQKADFAVDFDCWLDA